MTATTGPQPPADWRVPEREPNAFARLRQRRPLAAPALVGGIVGLGVAYTAWQDPNTEGGFFPGCPLKELTGLDCPGCGGTRALHALTRGDIATAIDHNLVLAIALPLLALAWLVWVVHAVRTTLARRRQAEAPAWPSVLRVPRLTHRGWLAVIGALIGFAVIRNVDAVPALDYLASEAT